MIRVKNRVMCNSAGWRSTIVWFILLMAFGTAISSTQAQKLSSDLRAAIKALESPAYTVFRKRQIPAEVFEVLFRANGYEWRLGDSSVMERVKLGCVSEVGDFKLLLNFAVISDSICIIAYEHGGISHGRDLVVVWYKGNKRAIHTSVDFYTDPESGLGTLLSPKGWTYLKPDPSWCLCSTWRFKEQVDESDLVFVGRVLSTGFDRDSVPRFNFGPAIQYVFLVSQIFKGVTTYDTLRVNSALMNMACGGKLKVGETYIVYAYHDHVIPSEAKIPPQLVWHRCGRTRLASDKSEIALLEAFRKNQQGKQ